MNYLDAYLDYFENLCVNHPDLMHDPSAKSSQVFQPITIEESFGDFTSSLREKGFIIRPIIYTKSTSIDGGGQSFMDKQGGLIVGHWFDPNDYKSKITAISKTEQMIDEFIQRMTYDSNEGHPFWNFSLNTPENISAQHISLLGDNSYTGWRIIFSWSTNMIAGCVDNVDGVVWEDIANPPPQTVLVDIFNFSGELKGKLETIVE